MSRHTLLFLIPSPLKNAHTSKTRNCFSIFVFPSRYSSPSLSPSLFSSLFLRIFKSSLIFVWNEYRISNWWPQSTAKPSFISTFWLAISQGQARFGRSFHSTKTSVVTSENKIWSPWFSASIDIPRFVNFSPGPYSRLQHVCIYMCVCISIRCIDDRSTILRIFVLFERREREKGECGATTGARISRFLRLVLLSRFVGRTDRPARPTTYRLFTIERHRDSSRLLFLHFYPRFRCNNGKHWSANSRSNR